MSRAAELLAAYDAQVRAHVPPRLPAGVSAEEDGPLLRITGFASGGFVGYRSLDGVAPAELEALIARQIDVFGERGEQFEWKLHGHDPAGLAERLLAAGFVPDESETVVVAPVAAVALDVPPPAGVALREVHARNDLERIGALSEAVYGDDASELVDDLEQELAATPDELRVVVAEAGGDVVSAAWVRFLEGTEFATLWGGSTLPAWRRRGIYRALVAHRARLAAERSARYVQVDASEDSRPILERLGFVAVTTTTPYVWRPH